VSPWKSFDSLKEYLKAGRYNCMEVQRGSVNLIKDKKLVDMGQV
jgi:hypothetical protein